MRLSKNFLYASGLLACCLCSCASDPQDSGDFPEPVVREVRGKIEVENRDVFLPGDNLELFVKEDATLNESYSVREGGYIVIPRAGRIPVAGLSRSQAERQVKDALQRTQLTEASVLVERTSKQALLAGSPEASAAVPKIMIYVTGAVPRPGTHYVPLADGRSLGVYEALLITGGLGRLAQDQRVEVMRMDSSGRRHRAVFDLRRVRQGKDADPAVGAGDVIHVPEKVFGF